MSTVATTTTVIAVLPPREVVRCSQCTLVQFRTTNDLCRRCDGPLPAPPRLDIDFGGPTGLREKSTVRFGSDQDRQHSRSRTAKELTIGRKLRELRDQRCLTQQDMAQKAGVPRTYISRIENARLLPGPVMLRRIADALEVTILDLLPKNGNAVAEDDPYWTSLAGSFSQLNPQQMDAVLEHVRSMLGEAASESLMAEPALAAQ